MGKKPHPLNSGFHFIICNKLFITSRYNRMEILGIRYKYMFFRWFNSVKILTISIPNCLSPTFLTIIMIWNHEEERKINQLPVFFRENVTHSQVFVNAWITLSLKGLASWHQWLSDGLALKLLDQSQCSQSHSERFLPSTLSQEFDTLQHVKRSLSRSLNLQLSEASSNCLSVASFWCYMNFATWILWRLWILHSYSLLQFYS